MVSEGYIIVLSSIWFVCGFILSSLLHTIYYMVRESRRIHFGENSSRTIDNTNTNGNPNNFIEYIAEIEMNDLLFQPEDKVVYSYQHNNTNIIIMTDP